MLERNNLGLPVARNEGTKVSTGELIMFADGDDWITEECVEKMSKCMKETNVDIVECGYMQWSGNAVQ